MKRFLSLLIAVVMVLSTVPVVSFAEDAVTIYIDPKNGSNENNGTEASPVQNFTTALVPGRSPSLSTQEGEEGTCK